MLESLRKKGYELYEELLGIVDQGPADILAIHRKTNPAYINF